MALRAAQYKRSKTASRQFLGHPQSGLNIGMRPIGRKRRWAHQSPENLVSPTRSLSEFSKFWLFPCRFFYLTA